MAGKIGIFVLNDDSNARDGLKGLLQEALAMLGSIDTGDEPPGGDMPSGHIPTQTDEDGRIVVPEGTAPQDLSDSIKKYWPREIWGDAARVSRGESSWKWDAENDTTGSVGGECQVYLYTLPNGMKVYSEASFGYFQINRCAHGESKEHWLDVDNNVRKAAELYEARGGWGDWMYTATRLGLI